MAWFFLRSPGCDDQDGAKLLKVELQALGRVERFGVGTEVDPTAAWFVVDVRVAGVPEVRAKLTKVGLSDCVDLIEPILRPRDGKAMAAQLALF